MAHCVEKISCEKCGSSDALQVFEEDGKHTGYCFACDTYYSSPYHGNHKPPTKPRVKKTPEQVWEEIDAIRKLPAVDLPSRYLRDSSLSYFGVSVALSEQDGVTPTVRYFPFYRDNKLIGYKAKLMDQKVMWSIGDMKGKKDLFGWEQAIATGGKRLFITEGEDDAVALFQALKEKQVGTKWEKLNPAVVSLCNGASGAKQDIANNLSKILRSFSEVVLVFDRDEAGQLAEREVLHLIPSARTISLPEKDPNECVIKGKSLALANACLFNDKTPKNTRIVLASSVYEEARKQAEWGISYPWAGLTKLTRGMRFGETYYLGAGVKMGKTTIRSALASHLLTEHGLKVFMAAPEETNKKTFQLICGQVAGRIFHDPEVAFDYEAYDRASNTIGDNLYLLNLYQHLGWESLRSDILLAAQEGCKAVFIDPITNLTNGVASGDANTQLQEISQDLAALALDFQLIVWIFCHLKAPENGVSHERGGKVMSHQFAGSRSMMRSCHMMVGLEGNKDPDIEEVERNCRRLVILEDREFGASGVVPIWYNKETGRYTEIINETK